MSQRLPDAPAGQCFHCLQPLPADGGYSATIGPHQYPVCCYGCQAVAQTIAQQGLEHFYQYRDTSNPLQVPLLPDELQQYDAYDAPELSDALVTSDDHQTTSITLSVEGMTCAACAWLIEQHLRATAGVTQVNVNATTERATVSWQSDNAKLSTLLKRIAQLGYRALPFQLGQQEHDFKQRRRYFVRRLGIAGLATMQVMMIAVGLYFGVVSDLDAQFQQFLWWISLLFATPVLLYSAQPFYLSALRSIQAQRLNMDVPVSIALLGAYGASAYATFAGHGEVYFESVSMFTFLLLLGRYLELLAKQKAMAAATNLMTLVPAVARRIGADGRIESVPTAELQIGDQLQVRPGEALPADGALTCAHASVNESLLTGESRPIHKRLGEPLLAGSINFDQPITMEVTATQQKTVIASIIRLQDQALARKPKLAETAERLASQFVKQLLLVAGLTFVVWSFVAPEEAFWVTLAVLVATCPCALALAAPTAVTGAIHRLNRDGVAVKNIDALQQLDKVGTVLLDKTGTLTTGAFTVQHQSYLSGAQTDSSLTPAVIDSWAASLEEHSEHPLAKPLANLTTERVQLTEFTNHPGQGLEANLEATQTPIRIGSLSFIQQWHPNFELPADANGVTNENQVILATPHMVLAIYQLQDELRPHVQEVLAECRQRGLALAMLTGDKPNAANAVAKQLGISQVHAQCSPAQKLEILSAYQQQHSVIMVGDGINDGPVLAQADIAVTFNHASDLSRTAADAVLMRDDFSALLSLFKTVDKGQRIMRQNIIWALLYNVGIIPIAVLGLVTPYLAAIGMSLSSLLVLLNSLRLYRDNKSET